MNLGIIPARFAASRFPGKLLADLNGKPVLQWTWERAANAELIDRLVIAAGDEEIFRAATNFGAETVKVFEDCSSGSDRIWLASEMLGLKSDLIINIQGDEPLIDPALIDQVIAGLERSEEAGVGTAAVRIELEAEYLEPSRVKVVLDDNGNAMYFSRSPIPHGAEIGSNSVYRHIGIYAYKRDVLEEFVNLPIGSLEKIENLEQLRLLEKGVKIHVEIVNSAGAEVNTEEDLTKARKIIASSSFN